MLSALRYSSSAVASEHFAAVDALVLAYVAAALAVW